MDRRSLRAWFGCVTVGVVLCVVGGLADPGAAAAPKSTAAKKAAGAGKLLVFIGGRQRPKGGAVYRCRLDLKTGELSKPQIAAEAVNPSFLAIHPSGRFLYAVNEAGRTRSGKGGAVSSFAIRLPSGELTPLNQESSGGSGPCHITMSRDGKFVLGANYGGGSVFALPVGADGKLGKATAFVQHKGKSVNPRRQAAPHAHSINLDAANRFAVAADLGLDKILVYRFDAAKGTLKANAPAFTATAPGAGPRHFAFHPGGKWAYVINEMSCTVGVHDYDATKGVLTRTQTISTLPKGFEGTNSCAEILVHPSGKFVYGSNRGHESIAIFAVDGATGRLRALGHEPTQGKRPRNFCIDPTGAYLLAANQTTGNVVVFRIDGKTGLLKATGHSVQVPGPACVRMMLPGSGQAAQAKVAVRPVVEVEEEVYRYTPANNGAGPMWCRGSTCLVRVGEHVLAGGLETIAGAKPLNNCRWMLLKREKDGWRLQQVAKSARTREPAPLACFGDGRVLMSVNPTLTKPDAYWGPARPQILQFDAAKPSAPFRTIVPKWQGSPKFTEHSYRSFAADGPRGEIILFQNVGAIRYARIALGPPGRAVSK